MSTDYCTATDVKTWLKIGDSNSDTLLGTLITTVSRWIDGQTDDFFGQTATTKTRTYVTGNFYLADVDPIATTTGLTVATDTSGDGTFETSWTRDTDFELWPVNAASQIIAEPWRQLRAIGSRTFPPPCGTARPDRLQVTATFGWPAVPAAIAQACIMQVGRMFERRNSVDGIVGETSSGFAVRVPNADRDVLALLAPYSHRTFVG